MRFRYRLLFLAALDSLFIWSAVYLSYKVLHPSIISFYERDIVISALVMIGCYQVLASVFLLYNKAWEYASIGELLGIIKTVTLSVIGTAVFQYFADLELYARGMASIWMLLLLMIGGSRFSWRAYRDQYMKPTKEMKKVLIIGAGQGGSLVARQLHNNPELGLKPVAYIDDDKYKQRLQIHGIPVAGATQDIGACARKFNIDLIVIAIPSLNTKELNRIFKECSEIKVKTQIMPKIEDVMLGRVSVSAFRDVQVEDLLGREQVELDIEGISEYVSGKTVMVTGAGGSIGSEICRQICEFNPGKIVLLGHGENSIYLIDMELRNSYGNVIDIVPVIGDIQDRNRIFEVMNAHRPDVVYHAAAHKHVPLMECNPREAVKNNVFGTKNVAEAADTFGVKTFVMISSDKAVNPTNVMGSTKRVAEMVIQKLDQESKTKFVAVRFGNVLGSRGSVIPLFKKQIKAGGPVTVTHPEMTRYFMTIPEASRLVIQAGSLARGGEVFVLDMGEPVKIVDLAKNLIRLSGYSIEEIGIHYTGIRPGEKMFEELLNEREVHPEPIYPSIFIGKAMHDQDREVEYLINQFEHFTQEQLKTYVINLANKRENDMLLVAD
ncbi:polysaccharide biosynthesis protein [Bacillus massilinigeriensis]|uniref:polysaccharide biosynthesis protein n=1 Tax=Bacillus mediterraneensis TaxID=1805474 RepID=UPI0008F8402E|nr:nucleoside-diphosphate sugar epimerase/dehydratase [Bacillus mediterraneensis]